MGNSNRYLLTIHILIIKQLIVMIINIHVCILSIAKAALCRFSRVANR